AKIDAARAAYDALTAEQQALVTNYTTLTTAEAAYDELETEANTVRIGSVDDWNSFADSVKNGNNYSGKTVLLTADVGPVTTMVEGTFSGTFDGDGHMLTVDITGGTVATFQNAANAVFQNFTLAGSVTGSGIHTGALVKSITGGTCSFKNVIVSANVNGAKGYVGGFVAHAGNGFTVSFKNCLYSGSINHTGTQGNFIGAFIGWSQNCTATIENCAFTGSYSNTKSFNNIGFSYNAPRSVTVSDFYSNASEVFVANVNRGTRLYTPGSYTSVEGLVINGDEWTFFTQYSDALSAAQSGGTLLMLDKAVTDAEALINAIGEVAYDDACKAKIDEARAAYDALTAEQQALVTNIGTLTDAETEYAALEAAAALAQAKTDAKDALDNYVNADDYRAAEQADLADAIAAGKTTIDNAESIDDVNTALAAAKTAIDAIKTDAELTAEEDQAAANAAMDKINAIGTVAFTYESKAKIDAAREAYDDLTDAQQALVTNYKTLTDAEEAYVALEAAAPLAITLSTDDNVLFTSVAVGGKPSDIVFNDQNKPVMSPVGKIPGSDRKQTVLDESRSNFYADCRGLKDGICRIGYSKAKSTENDVISGMIVDADGNVKYYGVLGYANPAPLTVFPFDVSGQYEVGDRIYIFNEYLNGDNMTDYSSALIDVTPEKLPEGLTATAGQTLADVAIPNPEGNTDGTWTWDDTSIPVDTVGEYTFAATFTPGDTSKFDIVHTNLTVTVTDPDQEAADAVIALINAIGTVENTAASKEKIDAARTAYDALTDAQKALVSNDETLTAAEARYAELKAEEELAAAKRTAKSALLSYKDTHDYRAEQKAELSNAIDDGIAAINAATNTDEVAAALEAAKAVMDAIKTDAQLTAEEELADAKADAKAELDSYKNAADYRPAQQTELTNAINAGNAAIDAAASTDGVATALANAKAAIDAIKTDAQLTAEEAAAKAQDWMSVRIDDRIYIKYTLQKRENLESVTVEYLDQDGVEAVQTKVYTADQLTFDGNDMFEILAVIAPAQIGDMVKVTILANGQSTEYEYSVAKYCEYLIANYNGENARAVRELAKATLEYGKAANDYFYGTGFYHQSTITSPYSAEYKEEALHNAKNLTNTLSVTDNLRTKLASAAFMALTQPEFRFYTTGLTEEEAYELNSKITTNVDGVTAKFYKNGDAILLEVKGIKAEDMDKIITITVGELGTITFSGYDFARMMAKSDDESIAALGAALYLYGDAAKKCFA
ncbi:MAG: hypothetical protein IKW76_06020, partial [Clostridia bacterium]|nr:hypothetical protein [Clostridia bacterium]